MWLVQVLAEFLVPQSDKILYAAVCCGGTLIIRMIVEGTFASTLKVKALEKAIHTKVKKVFRVLVRW